MSYTSQPQSQVDNRFAKIPLVVLADPQLTVNDKIVYAALYAFVYVKSGHMYVYPSINTLQTLTGLSRSSVTDSLSNLSDRKLIIRERQYRADGSPMASMTTFTVLSTLYSEIPRVFWSKEDKEGSPSVGLGSTDIGLGSPRDRLKTELYKQSSGSEEKKPSSSPGAAKAAPKWKSTSFLFKHERLQRLWDEVAVDFPALKAASATKTSQGEYYGFINMKKSEGYDPWEMLDEFERGFRDWLQVQERKGNLKPRKMNWLWTKNEQDNYWFVEMVDRAKLLKPSKPKLSEEEEIRQVMAATEEFNRKQREEDGE